MPSGLVVSVVSTSANVVCRIPLPPLTPTQCALMTFPPRPRWSTGVGNVVPPKYPERLNPMLSASRKNRSQCS